LKPWLVSYSADSAILNKAKKPEHGTLNSCGDNTCFYFFKRNLHVVSPGADKRVVIRYPKPIFQ
jgi:hypothetical protein